MRLVGEPLADPAWVPTAILSRRAARDVKLVLIGEGADETFGGYPTYIGANLSAVYRRLPSALRHILSGAIRRLPPSDRKTTVSYLLKRFMEGCSETGIAQHASWTSVMPGAVLQWLGIPRFDLPGDSSGDAVERAQRHDFENMLGDGLLTKTDRAAMSVGLEPRAPFLDPAILRFAAELPTRERVHRWRTKVFLKRYAERYLPARFVHQRKRGLSVPLSGWLRGPLRGWARERLGSGLIARCGISIPAVLDLLDDHLLRREDFARPLWALLVLTEWLEWWEERTLPVASRLPRAQSSERRSVLR